MLYHLYESVQVPQIKFSRNERGCPSHLPVPSLATSDTFRDLNGEILQNRRKIKPINVEKTLFGKSRSKTMKSVVDTDAGKFGGLVWIRLQKLL